MATRENKTNLKDTILNLPLMEGTVINATDTLIFPTDIITESIELTTFEFTDESGMPEFKNAWSSIALFLAALTKEEALLDYFYVYNTKTKDWFKYPIKSAIKLGSGVVMDNFDSKMYACRRAEFPIIWYGKFIVYDVDQGRKWRDLGYLKKGGFIYGKLVFKDIMSKYATPKGSKKNAMLKLIRGQR